MNSLPLKALVEHEYEYHGNKTFWHIYSEGKISEPFKPDFRSKPEEPDLWCFTRLKGQTEHTAHIVVNMSVLQKMKE